MTNGLNEAVKRDWLDISLAMADAAKVCQQAAIIEQMQSSLNVRTACYESASQRADGYYAIIEAQREALKLAREALDKLTDLQVFDDYAPTYMSMALAALTAIDNELKGK